MNEMINAVATIASSTFRERYRSVDVALDGHQFLAGNEARRTEF